MPRPLALLLPLGLLPLVLACGDKDDTDGTDGTTGDGGTEDCTIELASAGTVANAECEALVDILVGMEIDWQWTGDATYPDYNGIISTPVVGDVDGDGSPEIVFTTMFGAYYNYPGLLIVLDGVTGEQELMLDAVDLDAKEYISGSSGVALADLDNDGITEIIVVGYNLGLAAFHADGTLVWSSADRADDLSLWTTPGVADLDGDGDAEVVAGRAIFDSNGGFESSSDAEGWGGIGYSSVIADLDGDGQHEIISGCAAYDLDGDTVWDRCKEVGDGMPAIGDFDGDGQGEVFLSDWAYGSITMLDGDGSTIWSQYIAKDTGGGGPPAVADFDGDGEPEIAMYTGEEVLLIDGDGEILWDFPVTDAFAYLGGVTGFDFDDDGVTEVVATDYYSLYVLDGASGDLVMQADEFAGVNIIGNPVVADVDMDGRAEIVAGTNNSGDGEWTGLVVLKDVYDSWAPAPTTYNQHAWHPGVIADDLSPTVPVMPWEGEGEGRFRVSPNGVRGDVYAPAPNLTITVTDECIDCTSRLVRFDLAVQVGNVGGEDLADDFAVGVYGVTDTGRRELIDTAKFEGGLPAGATTAGVKLTGQFATSVGFIAIEAQVDGSEVRLAENVGERMYLDCSQDDNVVRFDLDCVE